MAEVGAKCSSTASWQPIFIRWDTTAGIAVLTDQPLKSSDLEPVDFIQVWGEVAVAPILRFHGHGIPYSSQKLIVAGAYADQLSAEPIYFGGQEYDAWPVQSEGIEANGDGTAVRPTAVSRQRQRSDHRPVLDLRGSAGV